MQIKTAPAFAISIVILPLDVELLKPVSRLMSPPLLVDTYPAVTTTSLPTSTLELVPSNSPAVLITSPPSPPFAASVELPSPARIGRAVPLPRPTPG